MIKLLNSLFGKIFLWFCLTLALGVAGNALIFSLIGERHFDITRHPGAFELFTLHQRLLLDTYEREGLEGLQRILKSTPRQRAIMRLYTEDGTELLGTSREPEEGETLSAQFATAMVDQQPPYAFGKIHPFIISSKTMADGQTVYLAMETPPPPPPRAILTSWRFWGNLIPALLITSVLTYLLARILTRPIRRLRNATRRIAGGDLRYRIGADVGRGYEEINALSEDFDRMAARVEQLVNSQRQLLRDISHELRSPLTRLNVALELARNRTGDIARAELNRIELDAARLDELITQMLTFIRMDHMDNFPEKKHINLGALLVSIARDTDVESQAKGVHVALHHEATAMIDAMPELLRRALENVLRNAIHFTPSGRTVSVALSTRDTPTGQEAHINVCDAGPGVPEDSLNLLFQPFYRVDSHRPHGTGGTGIGLAIAHRAIELHGGTITARNTLPCGLCMDISLPLTA